MAQPDCVRYLKREREHRAHAFTDKGRRVGAISSTSEAVAASDLFVV